MASLPSPPFISVEGIHNFRSIGGYRTTFETPALAAATTTTTATNPPTNTPSNPHSPTPNSSSSSSTTTTTRTTRSDLLFRSAEPSQITPAGIQTLKSLNITTIFDLRSLPEIEKLKSRTPIIDIPGINRIFTPVFKTTDYSPEALALRYQAYTNEDCTEGFRRAYADILHNAVPAYRRIFEHLRDRPGEACLVHCTAGKDRTGVLVALVLKLVGVEDRVIAEEYALTELGLAQWREMIVEYLSQDLEMHGGREGAERMIGARASSMMATLQMIQSKYQGAENYLKQQCGFSDEDIHIIRSNILEKPS